MDLRICFRVREPRDVDLILGQGMLRAGWDAHNLNAPGKFLVSAPGHDRPKRARAYLLTDQVVAETAAHYAGLSARCWTRNRGARSITRRWTSRPIARQEPARDNSQETDETPGNNGQRALAGAMHGPGRRMGVSELMRTTGWKRTKLYRHLREYAEAGRAIQVSRGRWRARTTEEPSP